MSKPSGNPPTVFPVGGIYGDEERIVRIFNFFLGLMLVSLLAGVVALLSNKNTEEAIITSAASLPVLLGLYMIRRKMFESTATLLAVFMIILMTLLATRGQGVHNISLLGFPAILIVASLVSRKRTMILLTMLSIICVAWLVFGDIAGLYTPHGVAHSVPGDFVSVSVILIATAVMVRLITESLFQSYLQVQKELKDRQTAEQALAFSEKRFYEAFHSSPVMMTIEDADHRFIDVNQAFCDVLGFNRDEVLGRLASELNMWVSSDDIEAIRRALSEQKRMKNMEVRFRRKSGEIGVALMSGDEFEVNGASYGLTSALDITDRKLIEAEREELIKELRAKNSELEQFTYTVSHDLKSPIITVKGFLGFLEQDLANGNRERVGDDVKRVNEAMDRMNRLLNELLELSRIGRLTNPPQEVPFADIVNDAVKLVLGRVKAGNITVQVQSSGLPVIFGDRQRLVEVLQNLIDNSAKFMGGQQHPRIEIGQRGEENGMPVLFVKDNGIGIAPAYHEKIFGLFNRLDPKVEGTGIGLALAKRIIEFHGGRIWVESQAGSGATFLFTLPLPGSLQKTASRL